MGFPQLRLSALVVCITVVMGCAEQPTSLRIACAANVKPALEEIANQYTEHTGQEVSFVSASSGMLVSQISRGGAFDVFFAANASYADSLIATGFARGPGSNYTQGALILYGHLVDTALTFRQNIIKARKIALPNPSYAPYGTAALEALINEMVYETTQEKWVFGTNVSQTNQFITSKAVDMGLTANSTRFISRSNEVLPYLEVDVTNYSPILQKAVVLRSSSRPKRARQFVHFVLSDQGQSVLEKFGYTRVQH